MDPRGPAASKCQVGRASSSQANPSMQRRTMSTMGASKTAGATVSGVTSRKFPVARFRASYPFSNRGNSTKPLPLGITRNSDSRQPASTMMRVSWRGARRRQAGPRRGGQDAFVAAVSTSPEGRPRKLKLAPVKGFRKREIARGAKHWLAPGAAVVTDGLGCWSALDEAACSHRAIRTGSGRQAARMASFKWVNTTLGNIKSAITGTYRKLGPDHAGRYLASFAWRYNRRYQLQTMIPRFVHSAARTQPMPYRLLIAG